MLLHVPISFRLAQLLGWFEGAEQQRGCPARGSPGLCDDSIPSCAGVDVALDPREIVDVPEIQ
jgi:hypothetical protein